MPPPIAEDGAAPAAGPLWAALASAVAGVALAGTLARLHRQAHAGVASFCAINATFNCDRVATSRFSVLLGLPVAVWGVLGFGLAVALAAWGLLVRGRSTWPRGLLLLVAAAAVAASLALALVSELLIGSWCLLCLASWAAALGLLGSALWACRPAGIPGAIRHDLAALRANPLAAAAAALLAVAGVAAGAVAYPRYWDRPAAPSAPAPAKARTVTGPVTVYEYSDYECPFCARAHFETKEALAGRPDVKVVRRHFPLDPTCNPAMKRALHPGACDLARAGICAQAQGRFAEMDDLLFANQEAKRPVEDLAREAGLDLARFRECLKSPATSEQLGNDIAAALRNHIPATPSFVVGDTVTVGRLPLELLPPAPAAK